MRKKNRLKFYLIVLCVLGIIFLPSVSKIFQLSQEEKNTDHRIQQEKLQKAVLETKKDKLEKDKFYIEKAAREKMGIVKKGEVIYKIVPEEE